MASNVVKSLLLRPKKDKGAERPRYARGYDRNLVHQADLLFLPDDRGFKYLLVVVDGGTRLMDCEPIKTKDNAEVLSAFKKIYARKTLSMPTNLQIDPGTEFRGTVKKYFDDEGTHVRVGKTARHRQQSLVEAKNKIIATDLFERMTQEEYITGVSSKEWVFYLPKVVKRINKISEKVDAKLDKPLTKRQITNQKKRDASALKKPEVLLDEGDKVRTLLEEPLDSIDMKKLGGKFRATDIRWAPEIRTIKAITIKEHQPAFYLLSAPATKKSLGNKNAVEMVAYTRNQLLPVKSDEDYGDASDILLPGKKQETFIAQKILGKKTINKKIHYLVKYRGHAVASYQPKNELMKNIHSKDLIDTYEE